ncbi:hypothetical protein GUJ93_ZPchr0013g37533 [Zizania palustris]|uniref:Uncharacterized protein n=1 Tax=Zizania palustris TaxID=103762 RepID=A0A8J5X1M9_ZIZPA|nr:hypothetical protein GUJ93_ZPchr0013g37533 [Zizania palustris]
MVEAENSHSSVESNLRSSSAAHAHQSSATISSNGVHKVLYDDAEHNDGEPPSEEVRSAAGGTIGKGENGDLHPGVDPKETREDSTNNHSETKWSSSCHFDDSAELSEELKLLESRLEEASVLINDKDSRIVELDALNHKQPSKPVMCNGELLSL